MRYRRFEYMAWAREQAGRNYPCFLAASGMPALSPEDLGLRIEDIRLAAGAAHGDPDIRRILAARYGLREDGVILAAGTSLANFLAAAAILDPGDDAVVETPTYEALPRLVEMMGARVIPLRREFEEGYRIDLHRIRESMTPRTRMIFLTCLHNPSGVAIPAGTLREIGDVARRGGATVVVDEVYLEYLPRGTHPSAASLGDPFVITSSITKAYGLGGLRIGWVAGPADIVRRAAEIHDLLDVECAAPSLWIARRFFDREDEIRERVARRLAENYPIFESWARSRGDLPWVKPDGGATVFPRLASGLSGDDLVKLLQEDYGTVAVPGGFFGSPGHIRIWIGGPRKDLEEGLRRLGAALDRLGSGKTRV